MFKNKLNTNTTKQRVSKPKVNLDKGFFFFFLRNAERKSHRGYEQDNNEKKQ